MLDAGRYLYVAYMCQQAVEKLLKAIIAQHGKENLPIHNLNRLVESAELSGELTGERIDLLAELTAYNIEARYGDYKESLSEVVDIQKASILYDHWIFEIVKLGLRDPCGNGCQRASEGGTARQGLCARGYIRGGQRKRNILHRRGRGEPGACSEKGKERGEIRREPGD
jgi:HEPN domain-containing protein